MSESISWGELAELTHATQVERFGWCICEGTDGQGQLADDCPKGGRVMSKCHAIGCEAPQQKDFYMCDYHYGVTCGDHLLPITECGCKL